MENHNGLSVPEIAKEKYGDGYMKRTADDLDACIKQAMYTVVMLAYEQGIVVYPKRKTTQKNPDVLSHHIEVWKILDPSNPASVDEFMRELEHKKMIGESRTKSYKTTVDMGYKIGAIPEEKYRGLTNGEEGLFAQS